MGETSWGDLSHLVGHEPRSVCCPINLWKSSQAGNGIFIVLTNISVLTRPEHLQEVFHDSDKHTKAVNNNSGYMMSQLLGQCVGLLSGDDWRTLRRVSEVPFLHRNMETYVSGIEQQVETFFSKLEQHGNLRNNLIHPAEDLKLLPFWAVAKIFYGELTSDLKDQLRLLVPIREELFKHVIRGGMSRFSWSRFFPTEANNALAAFKQQWQIFNQTAYEHARLSASPPPIVPMFEAVVQGTITSEQLYQTLDEALFANLDVTTGGISWNPVFLAAYPNCQERLRTEVMSKAPADFHKYLLSSSSYLAACISESSRLKPLAAFSVPQSAPTDRVIGGYVIPAGTNFIVDSYALNSRNEYWGADPTVYRPDRFLEMSTVKSRYHFWRFGFGPRQCMGKYVADLIIRAILVYLVKKYHLGLLETGTEWKRSSESWITHPDLLLKCEKIV